MRFLVDQPVSPKLAEWLRSEGHQAAHVRDRGLSSATDEEIFAVAADEDSVGSAAPRERTGVTG